MQAVTDLVLTTLSYFTGAETTIAQYVAIINLAGIAGVTAALVDGSIELFANSLSESNGSVADGKIVLADGSGTALLADVRSNSRHI